MELSKLGIDQRGFLVLAHSMYSKVRIWGVMEYEFKADIPALDFRWEFILL